MGVRYLFKILISLESRYLELWCPCVTIVPSTAEELNIKALIRFSLHSLLCLGGNLGQGSCLRSHHPFPWGFIDLKVTRALLHTHFPSKVYVKERITVKLQCNKVPFGNNWHLLFNSQL